MSYRSGYSQRVASCQAGTQSSRNADEDAFFHSKLRKFVETHCQDGSAQSDFYKYAHASVCIDIEFSSGPCVFSSKFILVGKCDSKAV